MLKNATHGNESNLPPFEQVIKLEVPVDQIHKRLLSVITDDFKHKDILAHALIGTIMAGSSGKIVYVYNALAGFTNEIDFKVGDIVWCTEEDRCERYDANKENLDRTIKEPKIVETIGTYKPEWKNRNVEICECEIVEIDLYRDDKLKVKFQSHKSYWDAPDDDTAWVNHKKCSLWANKLTPVDNDSHIPDDYPYPQKKAKVSS